MESGFRRCRTYGSYEPIEDLAVGVVGVATLAPKGSLHYNTLHYTTLHNHYTTITVRYTTTQFCFFWGGMFFSFFS